MFKRLRLPALVLATALTLLSPSVALARHYGREREHHHRFSFYFGYGPRHYGNLGYYDRWGYWHPYGWRPYGFYSRWGYRHGYPPY